MGFEKSDLVYILNAVLAAEERARAAPPALAKATALVGAVDGRAAQERGVAAVEPSGAWMALYTELFDFRFDAVDAPGAGARFIPLSPGDPLYEAGAARNYLLLESSTVAALADPDPMPPGSPYALHPSLLAILRAYEMIDDASRPTGALLSSAGDGAPAWPMVRDQAAHKLGLILIDADAIDAPLIATDAFGAYAPGPSGRPQLVTARGLIELDSSAPIETGLALRSGQSLLAAIDALPVAAHNSAVAEIKAALMSIGSRDLLNGWLREPLERFPETTESTALAWNGARLFQTARYAAEMAAKNDGYKLDAPISAGLKIQPDADEGAAEDGGAPLKATLEFDLPFLAELARQAAASGSDLVSQVAAADDAAPSAAEIAAEVVVVELAAESRTTGEADPENETFEGDRAAPTNAASLPPQTDVEF